jgi:N-acetylglucosaminyldiphosphoundecaprenol N-acetyl-beta-D-mannosaminyltransferase
MENSLMFNEGKYSVLGINISAVDYAYTVQAVITAAEHARPCSLSALAVHGVMTGVFDVVQNRRLNGLDFVVPDGQPVRWALHLLYGINLPDRVYGPDLTLKVLEAAALRGLPVFFYGSKPATLNRFVANIQSRYPELIIAGALPSAFRRLTPAEKTRVAGEIKRSDAKLVFVGLGCPRQEIWAFEYRGLLNMPILAVGAAFDFHAGVLPQAPPEWQRLGLEWLFRLIQEPKRLWRRYLFLNPLYLWGLFLQCSHLKRFAPSYPNGTEPVESFG